jgi:hypothetical protein
MTDIEKIAVFDDRIVQSRPKYGVEKGALSLTAAPFNAISANGSQQTYQVQVPSENVFLAKDVDWSATCALKINASFDAEPTLSTAVAPSFLIQPASDIALASFPLHRLTATMSATINDTTTTVNTSDVLNEVLRLADSKKNRSLRTTPTYLDTYQNYSVGSGKLNTPISGYTSNLYNTNAPNGAYPNFYFTDSLGKRLQGGTKTAPKSYTFVLNSITYTQYYVNGIPVYGNVAGGAGTGVWVGSWFVGAAAGGGIPAATKIPYYIGFKSTEKLVLSPFTFADSHEAETGLFGLQNIQLLMNMLSPTLGSQANGTAAAPTSATAGSLVGRVVRYNPAGNTNLKLSDIAYNEVYNGSPYASARVNVQFLTPSLDLPLPPKSIVPYMEFPRYVSVINTPSWNEASNGIFTTSVQSQTITLPSIPDLMIIYAKPTLYANNDADWYMPITNISMNFDNFSGLLSSQTPEQLYQLSYNNGLEMDFSQWSGQGFDAGGQLPLTGGFLVIRPGKDLTLQTGQASGLQGNYSFQFQAVVNCNNPNYVKSTSSEPGTFPNPYLNLGGNVNLWVITVNSGFFESIKGSSRIIKNVVSEADVINAPLSNITTREEVKRYVGGVSIKGLLNSAVSAVKSVASNPTVRNIAEQVAPHAIRGIKSAISKRLM